MKNTVIETTTKQGNFFYILTLLEDVTMGKYDDEKRTYKRGTQYKLGYKPMDFTLPNYHGDEQSVDFQRPRLKPSTKRLQSSSSR